MNRNPSDDRPGSGGERRRLEAFFRDELRLAAAEAPAFDELAAYVEGDLGPEERAALEERLADDPALRQEVDDLRELHAQMRRPKVVPMRRRPAPVILAGLAAAAAVVALVLWLRPPAEDHQPGGGERPVSPRAPIAVLKDGDLRVALSADGSVSGLPALDPQMSDAVRGALRGALPSPPDLSSLRTGSSALMGPASGAGRFASVSPLGTRVSDERPTFRWTPHPEAQTYEVTVLDEDLRKRSGSGPVTGVEWRPERPLPRGRTYVWQVSALTASGRVTVPAPPASEARFELASPAVLAEVERARAAAPGSRLLAVVALVHAGLLDDAEYELDALAGDNPRSPQVRSLNEALRDLRR